MAEGWARHLFENRFESFSAGIEKHGMNRNAVKVMAEAGVDISGFRSKTIDELPEKTFDLVVTLCNHASETCPVFQGKTVHHGFPDPPKLAEKAKNEEEALVQYRYVRDVIRAFVGTLPNTFFGD